MTVQQFQDTVNKWLAEAKHPRFKRLYTECVYQPILELMQLRRLMAWAFASSAMRGNGMVRNNEVADKLSRSLRD
jgi:hypothetical protein